MKQTKKINKYLISKGIFGDMNLSAWNKKKQCGAITYDGEKYIKKEGSNLIQVFDLDDAYLRQFKAKKKDILVSISDNETRVYACNGYFNVYNIDGSFKIRFKDVKI